MKLYQLVALSLAIAIVPACSKKQPAAVQPPATFFPLTLGTSWQYQQDSPTNPFPHTRTVSTSMTLGGTGYFLIYRHWPTFDDTVYYRLANDRLLQFTGSGDSVLYDMTVGDNATFYTRRDSVPQPPGSQYYTVLATAMMMHHGETVALDIGTFSGCIRVHVRVDGTVYDSTGYRYWGRDAHYWYAPDVGLVKYTHSGVSTYLTSYQVR